MTSTESKLLVFGPKKTEASSFHYDITDSRILCYIRHLEFLCGGFQEGGPADRTGKKPNVTV